MSLRAEEFNWGTEASELFGAVQLSFQVRTYHDMSWGAEEFN
jgi:hypothetical protein